MIRNVHQVKWTEMSTKFNEQNCPQNLSNRDVHEIQWAEMSMKFNEQKCARYSMSRNVPHYSIIRNVHEILWSEMSTKLSEQRCLQNSMSRNVTKLSAQKFHKIHTTSPWAVTLVRPLPNVITMQLHLKNCHNSELKRATEWREGGPYRKLLLASMCSICLNWKLTPQWQHALLLKELPIFCTIKMLNW